ncbi:hypothetical protein CLW00_105135 [Mongoliibacter ruber]|uniref:Uncharacterized protein n=1 Tax=Mongoliibacter ruber TaxID=1750599 RepID=A0A2T0WNC6_9BACT|nr:hypothetical protein CLW00_105135 [Mongoliibacter ruber]
MDVHDTFDLILRIACPWQMQFHRIDEIGKIAIEYRCSFGYV